jgi:hypothetical protein
MTNLLDLRLSKYEAKKYSKTPINTGLFLIS